jgi:hypothetical protein
MAAPMGSVLVRAVARACPLALDVRRTNLVSMTLELTAMAEMHKKMAGTGGMGAMTR